MIRVFRYLIGSCLTAVESIERGAAQQQGSFLKENHLVDKSQNILFNIPQGVYERSKKCFHYLSAYQVCQQQIYKRRSQRMDGSGCTHTGGVPQRAHCLCEKCTVK